MSTPPFHPQQLPLLDKVNSNGQAKGRRYRHRKVERTLAMIHQLHEQLNAALYNAAGAERPIVHGPSEAAVILAPFLDHLEQEELWILLLNTRNKVIKVVRLYRGSLNASQVRVAEVFREAIRENAAAILLAHNHPSGNVSASPIISALLA